MKYLAVAVSIALVAVTTCATAAQPTKAVQTNQQTKRGYQPTTARGKAAGEIVSKWAGYVQRVYGTTPSAWANAMRGTFAEADVNNMTRAAKRGTYEAMMGTLLGQKTSDAKVIDAMAKSDGSLNAVKTIGSPAEDLVYTMVAPCRILDTRNAGGRLSSSVPRDIFVHSGSFASQGGVASSCGIPSDPSAVAINVATVIPDADGFLTVYPSGTARPSASSVNYARGSITSNEIIAKTTLGAPSDLTLFSQAGADVVVDIVGYFMAPEATALECVNAVGASVAVPPGQTAPEATSAACPVGYTIVGGECNTVLGTTRIVDEDINFSTFGCQVFNGGVGNETLIASARCCRLPGR